MIVLRNFGKYTIASKLLYLSLYTITQAFARPKYTSWHFTHEAQQKLTWIRFTQNRTYIQNAMRNPDWMFTAFKYRIVISKGYVQPMISTFIKKKNGLQAIHTFFHSFSFSYIMDSFHPGKLSVIFAVLFAFLSTKNGRNLGI